ncbi:hypothetical protein PHPALM_31269 [Phytophthora palmivora]|uniref:SWIM-type domain-containing protein n=1 Tax=Phytophthora palmivora TaxID=4796 RepID=A0A2P4X2Z9_9STRA|nr:hypothetical protein PHPALM_31269 [Phytophthora palmivora]
MTYSRTVSHYDMHRDEFKSLPCRHGQTALWEYFCYELGFMLRNVDGGASCHLATLGYHTNNRVENFFGKLRHHRKGHFTMKANLKYDRSMDTTVAYSYAFKDNGSTITVRRENSEYLLQKKTWECDSEPFQTMKLPCHHFMVCRKVCGCALIIPFETIDARYDTNLVNTFAGPAESHEMAVELQDVCWNAVFCCAWLRCEEKQHIADPPSKSMIGFDFDLCYSDLYCIQDSVWLNYKAMRDAGVFLGQYKNKSTMMIPLPKDSKTKQTVDLSTSTVKAIVRPVDAREFVLLPISIGGVQWEGLVIDKASRTHTYQEEQEASTILG